MTWSLVLAGLDPAMTRDTDNREDALIMWKEPVARSPQDA